jgi:hypothetical protein
MYIRTWPLVLLSIIAALNLLMFIFSLVVLSSGKPIADAGIPAICAVSQGLVAVALAAYLRWEKQPHQSDSLSN